MIGKEDNWHTALKEGLWIAKRKNPIRSIKKGDLIIAYLSKHKCAFFGVFKATSDFYQDGTSTQFDVNSTEYPFRVKIEPGKILDKPVSIRPIIKDLSFIKNPEKWGRYFQAPIRQISREDFERILSYIRTENI